MKRKTIIGLILFILGSLLVFGFILFDYYYSLKAGLGGLELVIPILLAVGLGIALFVLALIYLIIKCKRLHAAKFSNFVPLIISIGSIILAFFICFCDYAASDKGTFGIPKEYQQKLSYSTFMEESIYDVSYDNGDEIILTDDEDGAIAAYLNGIEVSKPIPESQVEYANKKITIYYGTDDFYGLKLYENGCMSATYMGDILGPYYEMYYTYDSSCFSTLASLIEEAYQKSQNASE